MEELVKRRQLLLSGGIVHRGEWGGGGHSLVSS